MEVWFYHLERSAAEPVLAELLDKTLQRGWRAVVRTGDRGRLPALSDALWRWRPDSFLGHAADDDPHPERQPILLTDGRANPNGAQALFLLDDADLAEDDAYERAIAIFDGRDDEALTRARALWATCRRTGRAVSYWRQEESGWRKQS